MPTPESPVTPAEQDAADAEIDRLVYGLYGLALEEIAMVERSCGCSENGA